jgi:hypothetical protein
LTGKRRHETPLRLPKRMNMWAMYVHYVVSNLELAERLLQHRSRRAPGGLRFVVSDETYEGDPAIHTSHNWPCGDRFARDCCQVGSKKDTAIISAKQSRS